MTGSKLHPLFGWRAAIAESDLPATHRHVALVVSTYANERGASAFPGASLVARDTGLHLTTVKRALNALVGAGFLVVVVKGGAVKGGRRLATEYQLAIPSTGSTKDPVQKATGSFVHTDRGSCARGPVAQGDPNSSVNSSENSSHQPEKLSTARGSVPLVGTAKDHVESLVERGIIDAAEWGDV